MDNAKYNIYEQDSAGLGEYIAGPFLHDIHSIVVRGLGSTLQGIPTQYEQYSAEPQDSGASFNGKWCNCLGRMEPIKAPQLLGGLKQCTACGASCNRYGPALYKLKNGIKTVWDQIWM